MFQELFQFSMFLSDVLRGTYMNYFLVLITLTVFSGCTKTNPNPEATDPIYIDLNQELDVATKGLEDELKNLSKLYSEKEKVVPQTGQVKYADKKIYETQSTITKLQQQKQFFEIKMAVRKNDVQNRYSESLKGGRQWPDKEELANYNSTIKLQREKLNWDRNKGVKKVPRGTKEKPNTITEE